MCRQPKWWQHELHWADRSRHESVRHAVRQARALAFEFAVGQSTAELVTRLAASGWRGAIVGPHGSGKSTLLAALLAELHGQGHNTLVYRLHDGERRLNPSPAA